LSTS
jgi:hypothetical protein